LSRSAAVLGVTLFAILWVLPGMVLVGDVISDGPPAPVAGAVVGAGAEGVPGVVSATAARLLGMSVWMAATATALALMVSVPAAAVWASAAGGRWAAPAVAAAMALVCVTSPMVYSFGWQRMLDARGVGGAGGVAACTLIWAAWLWPIPAMMLGAAWRRHGRAAFEAALLDASPVRAFIHVGIGTLARPLVAAALILFTLTVGNYVVPHAWGVRVYATELLLWTTETTHPSQTVRHALPLIVVVAMVALGGWHVMRRSRQDSAEWSAATSRPASRGWLVAAASIFVASFALPIGGLVWRIGSWTVWREAWQVHRGDFLGSVAICLAAGLLAVVAACTSAIVRRAWRVGLVVALLYGIVPAALVGAAVYGVYVDLETWLPGGRLRLRPWNDVAWMTAAGLAARYGWIAFLAVGAAAMLRDRELDEQAAVDGASWPRTLWQVRLAGQWPALACAMLAIAALSVSDVATATLVQVSSVRMISLLLVEAMHRFEDGLLISISLWLLLAALPGCLLAVWMVRRA